MCYVGLCPWWGGTPWVMDRHQETQACGAAGGPHLYEGVEGRAEKVDILRYGMIPGAVSVSFSFCSTQVTD